jgi:hypothetical protein
MNIRVDKESLTNFQNVICTPHNIHHPTKLRNQMHTTLNLRNRDNWSVTAMTLSGPWDLVHLKIRDQSIERCEPFNVSERVLEMSIFWCGGGPLEAALSMKVAHNSSCTLLKWSLYHPFWSPSRTTLSDFKLYFVLSWGISRLPSTCFWSFSHALVGQ